jgi:hypothetical protein
MEGPNDDYLEQLAKASSLTFSSTQRAARATQPDHNMERLKRAADY